MNPSNCIYRTLPLAAIVVVCALGLEISDHSVWAQTVDAAAIANVTDATKDVNVEADSMEVLDAQKKAIFTGHVNATRSGTTLASERMEVNYADAPQADGTKKTEVTVINATGGVKITTGKQIITGNEAILDVKGNLLTVKGNVVVTEGSSVIHGENLKVDLKSKVSAMTGGRVKGSFVPNSASK